MAQLHQSLNSEVIAIMQQAYAPRTHSAYRTHRRAYLSFCVVMGLAPVPVQPATLCLYATVLARSPKYSSIKQYLNIVRILHLEWNLPNPMTNCYQYKCVMRGIRRQLVDQPNRKLPMTTDLLLKILRFLDLSLLPDCALWAAILLAFYGLLRIASVLCYSPSCSHARHTTHADLQLDSRGLNVVVRATKTIQFNQRHLVVPLPRTPDSALCPSQAMMLYLQRAGPARHQPLSANPLFVISLGGDPLTSSDFNRRVKDLVARAGGDNTQYSGHSLRRGGACLAYNVGVPVDTIRSLGDWASNTYTAYVLPERPLVARAVQLMADSTINSSTM